MDQATEPVPAQNPGVGAWGGRNRTPGRRSLLQCPVRAMQVVMVGVLAEDQPQVSLAGDQHPVQALAPGAGNPSLRDRIRSWCPDRGLDDPDPGRREHRREEMQAGMRELLSQLDGSRAARVAMLADMTREELEAVGGAQEDD